MAVLRNKKIKINEKRSKTKDYVNNETFYAEICAWLDLKKKDKDVQLTQSIAYTLTKIAEGCIRKPNWSGYSYKDRMVSEGIYNCFRYVDRFNPEKSKNPFAYFTTICWSSFVKIINEEKKHSMKKKHLINQMYTSIPAGYKKKNSHDLDAYTLGLIDETFQPINIKYADGSSKHIETNEEWIEHCKQFIVEDPNVIITNPIEKLKEELDEETFIMLEDEILGADEN